MKLTMKERISFLWYSVALLAVMFLIGYVENGSTL